MNPYFNQDKENKPVPAFNWFIEINGEKYLEILDTHIENIMPGQFINEQGIVYNTNTRRFIHPNLNVNGYVQISVVLNDKTRYVTGVHRLIMLVFKYQYGCEKMVVNHIDGNKHNNSFDNLEWTTQQQNAMHAAKNGLLPINEDAPKAKLTNDQVREICEELSKERYYGQYQDLAKRYNISHCMIESIATGKNWTNISKNYDIDYSFKINQDKIDENTVRRICEELSKERYNGQFVDLSKKYGIKISTIKNIAYGNCWTNISKEYNLAPKAIEVQDLHAICQILQEFGKLDKEVYNEIGSRLNINIDSKNRQIIWRLFNRKSHIDIVNQYIW